MSAYEKRERARHSISSGRESPSADLRPNHPFPEERDPGFREASQRNAAAARPVFLRISDAKSPRKEKERKREQPVRTRLFLT